MSAEQKKKTAAKSAKPKAGRKGEVLCGDLTLQNAAAIKSQFVKAVAGRSKKIVFRFEDVSDVDLSFVQILCSAHRMAHDKGKSIEFQGCWPEPFSNLIKESGLNEHVGCVADCSIECPWLDNS